MPARPKKPAPGMVKCNLFVRELHETTYDETKGISLTFPAVPQVNNAIDLRGMGKGVVAVTGINLIPNSEVVTVMGVRASMAPDEAEELGTRPTYEFGGQEGAEALEAQP